MLDQLEALRALRDHGTMGRAAAELRVTPSAVSKRIASLETRMGVTLVEPEGRRVRLTPEAQRLLAEAQPLLARLQDLLTPDVTTSTAALRIAASESMLCAWLPGVLRQVVDRLPGLTVEMHAHRGPTLLERVRSGDYAIGVCVDAGTGTDLEFRRLGDEELVVVPSGLRPLPRTGAVPIWAIEERSLTWQATTLRWGRARKAGVELEVVGRLESFTALVQVARAGFANALVPRGVALALGVPAADLLATGLTRPLAVVGRRTTFQRRAVADFVRILAEVWPENP